MMTLVCRPRHCLQDSRINAQPLAVMRAVGDGERTRRAVDGMRCDAQVARGRPKVGDGQPAAARSREDGRHIDENLWLLNAL